MDGEGWAKVCVVIAATLVAVGSGLQALNQLREYEDIYEESEANAVAGQAVRFFGAALGFAGLPISFRRVREMLRDLLKLMAHSRSAIAWAKRARATDPEKWSRALVALVQARNWMIVLAGSSLAIVAGVLDLAHYLGED